MCSLEGAADEVCVPACSCGATEGLVLGPAAAVPQLWPVYPIAHTQWYSILYVRPFTMHLPLFAHGDDEHAVPPDR